MLDLLLNGSELTSLTPEIAIITVISSIILGLIISITYMKTFGRANYAQNFILTLVMIPPIVSIVILLVGSNVARAFSLAGVFSIIRFRSNPGDPKDISYIFFALAAGLACGVGLIGYAFLFTVILCLATVILHITKFGFSKNHKKLTVTIPENLNYSGVFDEVFQKYTKSSYLEMSKTKELGSVFELRYDVILNKDIDEKEFLDELRCRNGNLPIMLSIHEEKLKK